MARRRSELEAAKKRLSSPSFELPSYSPSLPVPSRQSFDGPLFLSHILTLNTSCRRPTRDSAHSTIHRQIKLNQTCHSDEYAMAHIIQSRAHAEVHDLLKRAAEDATPAARSILEDLVRRQSTGSDSNCPDQTTGLTGGAIAGIVIGSIFGLLLLLWIIRSCMNPGAPPQEPRRGDRWVSLPGVLEPSNVHSIK